jgi:hypothetical protein
VKEPAVKYLTVGLCLLALAACGENAPPPDQTKIKVRSTEQNQLHQLDAMNLAIGLKRAIYDSGYTCKRITDAGFAAEWKNLDMWVAHCEYDQGPPVDWAIFAGPDGGAQVRNCKDVDASVLPKCEIKKRPKGSFGNKPARG